MEKMLGRPVVLPEEVHHRNGIRHDNQPGNLELWLKSQPPGQRLADMIPFCVALLKRYAPEYLRP